MRAPLHQTIPGLAGELDTKKQRKSPLLFTSTYQPAVNFLSAERAVSDMPQPMPRTHPAFATRDNASEQG